MTPVEKLQLKNAALRVLHAPGGPLAGGVPTNAAARHMADFPDRTGTAAPLELSLVFDGALSKEAAKAAGADIVAALKNADEIFRNVRCNVVFWLSDDKITHEPTAAAMVQMGRCFEGWEQQTEPARKRLELLLADLKKFEARSRLLILVTDGRYAVKDRELLVQQMHPFLRHRLLVLTPQGLLRGNELLQAAKGE